MTIVYFHPDNESDPLPITLREGESILDGVLREGHDLPFGCKSGICQSCIVKAVEGIPTPNAQKNLRESQKLQNYFLACSCVPDESLTFSRADLSGDIVKSKVIEKSLLNDSIFRLRIEKNIDYRPGQFVTLWRDDRVARSYSLASHPDTDTYLEFHIKRVPNGAFSDWAWHHLEAGQEIGIQGPLGDCVYNCDSKDQRLFLSGIGTGIAPLYGILHDALQKGHKGTIKLLLGARSANNFYYQKELEQLSKENTNIDVTYISQDQVIDKKHIHGDIYEYSRSYIDDYKGLKVFLCGAESFVRKMKKQCFLAGTNMSDIHSDAFLPFRGS